jgi:hypothetical protein
MKKSFSTAVVLWCVSFFVFAGSAFGQTGNASLGGIATDQTGALLPGVTITVTNTEKELVGA